MFELDEVRGRFFDALDEYDLPVCAAVLAEARERCEDVQHTLWLDYLAAILHTEQSPPRWDRAADLLVAILEADPERPLRARVHLERALVADYTGDYAQAIAHNRQALHLFRSEGDQVYVAKVLKNTGIAHTHAYEYGNADVDALHEALACHENALLICQSEGEERLAASVEHELGLTCKALARWSDALRYFQARADKCRRFGWQRSLALTLNNLGEVHAHLSEWQRAAACYTDALDLLDGLPADDSYERADMLANLARARAALGDAEGAANTSDQAIELVERIRFPLATEATRTGFFGTRMRIYDERIQLALDQGQAGQAFDALERAKSRHFIELLAGRATRSPGLASETADPQRSVAVQAAPLTLDQVQQRLPDDMLLLEYYLAEERAGALVITASTCEYVELLPGLAAMLARLLDESGARPERLTPDLRGRLHAAWPLSVLYAELIAPLRSHLAGFRRLCIVPHRTLHYVPFHALTRLADGQLRYWTDDLDPLCEIVYAPSATVLLASQLDDDPAPSAVQREYHDRNPARPPLVGTVSGYPPEYRCTGALVLSHGPDLVFAAQEGEAVVQAMGGRLLANETADSGTLFQDAASYRLIHFACHGFFDAERPLCSGIDLADGRLTLDAIMARLRLHADLVTLSGCETGRSRVRRGDELIGLARAFLLAGASALIVTLWRTDDLAAGLLMAQFYAYLAAGWPPARALRQAQLHLRAAVTVADVLRYLRDQGFDAASAEDKMAQILAAEDRSLDDVADTHCPFAHPYYWAPYFLIGARRMNPGEDPQCEAIIR